MFLSSGLSNTVCQSVTGQRLLLSAGTSPLLSPRSTSGPEPFLIFPISVLLTRRRFQVRAEGAAAPDRGVGGGGGRLHRLPRRHLHHLQQVTASLPQSSPSARFKDKIAPTTRRAGHKSAWWRNLFRGKGKKKKKLSVLIRKVIIFNLEYQPPHTLSSSPFLALPARLSKTNLAPQPVCRAVTFPPCPASDL